MISKSASFVIDRATFLGGLDGRTQTGGRHDGSRVLPEASAAYEALRELVSVSGFDFFKQTSSPALIPAKDPIFNLSLVDFPVNCQELHAVDVQDTTDDWLRLEPIPWTGRHLADTEGLLFGLTPIYYSVESVGTVSGTTEAPGRLALIPGIGAGRRYVLVFTARFTPLTSLSGLFLYPNASAVEWHVADLVVRLAGLRDGDAQERVALALDMRERAQDQLIKQLGNTQRQGQPTMRRARIYRSGSHGGSYGGLY